MSPEPAPQVATLEEARELIQVLWLKLAEQGNQIEALVLQVEAQAKQIKALEEKLNTNSRNSSKPPSTDPGSGKKSTGSGKKAGGQPGHAGRGRSLFTAEAIDQAHALYPAKQCGCGGKVSITRLHRHHQTIDIPQIKAHITEYQLYAGAYQGCGKHHEAVLPGKWVSNCWN